MYKIDEASYKEKYTLIVPATLDDHFPFIKYMFWSKDYRVEILDNTEGIVDAGLAFANNEMCYPFILIVGQVVQALRSGRYDLDRTRILVPTAGDACRGACYIGLLIKALKKAGFEQCKVITLNVRHIEEELNMKLGLGLAVRGLYAMMYGDILMLLANQVRPYEKEEGSVAKLHKKWSEIISNDLKDGKNLTSGKVKANMKLMCRDFADIERTEQKKQKVSLVGEFYAKYCALGNWNVQKYMEQRNCEVHINGLSWYAIYYIDTHMPEKDGIERRGFLFVRRLISGLQDYIIACLREHGFYSMDSVDVIKEYSRELVNQNFKTGDGWLMGAEVIGSIKGGYKKVLCVAPFGCMPNACAGRGLYPYLQRCFPEACITSVETDASGSTQNYYNRVEMLIHAKV